MKCVIRRHPFNLVEGIYYDSRSKKRLKWIEVYEATGHAGSTCLRCGISLPTLRKWLKRYQTHGLSGLESLSRRPLRSPNRKVFAKHEQWIMDFRKSQLGASPCALMLNLPLLACINAYLTSGFSQSARLPFLIFQSPRPTWQAVHAALLNGQI